MFGEGTDAQGGNDRDPNNPGLSGRWSVVDALRDEIRLIDTLGAQVVHRYRIGEFVRGIEAIAQHRRFGARVAGDSDGHANRLSLERQDGEVREIGEGRAR